MTDDDDLAAFLRAAASADEAPPASFGHAEVLAASHRIGRRRAMLAGGALVTVLVAGLGVAIVPQLASNDAQTTASGAPAGATSTPGEAFGLPTTSIPLAEQPAVPGLPPAADGGSGGAAPDAGPPGAPVPGPDNPAPDGSAQDGASAAEAPALPGAPASTSPQPRILDGPGFAPNESGGCGSAQDPQLRGLVDRALPQVAGAPAGPTTSQCLAAGERAVSVQATDGSRKGVLSVVFVPKGSAAAAGDARATTASGGTVSVSARSDTQGAPAPFADRVAQLARDLAKDL